MKSARFVRQLAVQKLAIEQLNGLGELWLGGAFAGAGAGARGLAEGLEETIGQLRARQGRGACTGGQTFEHFLRTGDLADRVQHLLGGEQVRPVVRKELFVLVIGFVWLGTGLIRVAVEDGAQQVFAVEAVFRKILRQRVQQRRVGRRVGRPLGALLEWLMQGWDLTFLKIANILKINILV